jgi:hypothetical protein
MKKLLQLKLSPASSFNEEEIRLGAAQALGYIPNQVTGFHLIKRSLDARSREPAFLLSLELFIDEPFVRRQRTIFNFPDLPKSAKTALIVGAGPAGLFAALKCIESGIKPIVIERGKQVRERRRDLAILNREGIINPESNYCFGEGGAGTYSDGKLYTRSIKRGNVNRILNLLVKFGADESILYDAHPHVGTNKLPDIISAIRKQIQDSGGEVHFEKKLTGLQIQDNRLQSISTADGDRILADAFMLATGHSARDIFCLLHINNIAIQAKPFALGVRVEHPQELVDRIQYHCSSRNSFLPPASYSLVEQVAGRGVFSFCMCPGGIIAIASTNPGELVVNGWSPSKRNNPFANSGIVVSVESKDLSAFSNRGPLAAMYFQESVEQKAFAAGGGLFVAPAARMTDFVEGRLSATLPACSYIPGIRAAQLDEVLPPFIHDALKDAFLHFGKKMKGYFTEEALVVATESRTSSPVRIPRDPNGYFHPQVRNLFPAGEGAGYAGGIVSAAMDGENLIPHLFSVP